MKHKFNWSLDARNGLGSEPVQRPTSENDMTGFLGLSFSWEKCGETPACNALPVSHCIASTFSYDGQADVADGRTLSVPIFRSFLIFRARISANVISLYG